MSLAELGRFQEAIQYETEAIKNRRSNEACAHHRLGTVDRKQALPFEGRLG